jgi:hypothetical protein
MLKTSLYKAPSGQFIDLDRILIIDVVKHDSDFNYVHFDVIFQLMDKPVHYGFEPTAEIVNRGREQTEVEVKEFVRNELIELAEKERDDLIAAWKSYKDDTLTGNENLIMHAIEVVAKGMIDE